MKKYSKGYKVKLLLLALCMGMVPLSCEYCDSSSCECESNNGPQASFYEYKFSDLTLDLVEADLSYHHDDGNFTTNDSLSFEDQHDHSEVAIQVLPVNLEHIGTSYAAKTWSLSSSLVACSPIQPPSKTLNRIEAINIISNKTLTYRDDTIATGDTINYLFNLYSNQSPYRNSNLIDHDSVEVVDFANNGNLFLWVNKYHNDNVELDFAIHFHLLTDDVIIKKAQLKLKD